VTVWPVETSPPSWPETSINTVTPDGTAPPAVPFNTDPLTVTVSLALAGPGAQIARLAARAAASTAQHTRVVLRARSELISRWDQAVGFGPALGAVEYTGGQEGAAIGT
jgi:hypothetical protein